MVNGTANNARPVDVAVVGAGLAGLVAARDLLAAGLTVVVLEARNRVGGRILNHALDNGAVVEVGGQWVGPTQDRILALAEHWIAVDPGVDVMGVNARLMDSEVLAAARVRYSAGS